MNNKSVSCGDLGNKTCDFVATGSNEAEAKQKMLDHATREHADHRDGPDWEEKLGRKIDGVLQDGAPDTEEDASQGSEFLDDGVAKGGNRSGRVDDREAPPA